MFRSLFTFSKTVVADRSAFLFCLVKEAFKSIVDKFTPSYWKQDCASNLDEPAFPKVVEPAGF